MDQQRDLVAAELEETWPLLSIEERVEGFRLLPPEEAEEFFLDLSARDQADLVLALPRAERRLWLRLLPPDDVADLIQEAEPEERADLLALLDETTRREVTALLAYEEDEAGGLMNPRFIRVRPDMTVDEAIAYLRRQALAGTQGPELLYYGYVLDADQHLLGVVSLRQLLASSPRKLVRDVMEPDVVTVPEEMDQESVARQFEDYDLVAIPVIDAAGRMKGVVTVDDIVDVVREEATEDIQKYGGMEALDEPYLQIDFLQMIRKRVGWLSILFVSEMFTYTAVSFFEGAIEKAAVLAAFMPLIISSGGNSGSQASTLVIRAMAVGDVRLRDWWRVIRRELAAGLALGSILGLIGLVRVILWHSIGGAYGPYFLRVAFVIGLSVLGVVTWGTFAGSVLPMILRRLGFDPASASAPFVATLVDVTGLVIYFSVAVALLRGTLL
ncbi:MAG TPA: magnesium transporter [Longimicrobiales bacterium]|nr:magnesium transporter [Longimicrobiales bacterium]